MFNTELSLSTEVENSLLLAVSDLLINLLLPLCSSSSSSDAISTSAISTLSALTPAILASYVYDNRWSRTPALHTQRLYVLSLLLQAPLVVRVKADHVAALMGELRPTGECHASVLLE